METPIQPDVRLIPSKEISDPSNKNVWVKKLEELNRIVGEAKSGQVILKGREIKIGSIDDVPEEAWD